MFTKLHPQRDSVTGPYRNTVIEYYHYLDHQKSIVVEVKQLQLDLDFCENGETRQVIRFKVCTLKRRNPFLFVKKTNRMLMICTIFL